MSWIQWHGNKVKEAFETACRDSLRDAMEATGDFIDNNTVPLDESTLMKSKTIEDDKSEVAVWIGYGGGGVSGVPIVPYAIRHHEVPANFQEGRQHNYVREPMNTKFPNNLKKAVQKHGLSLR